MQRIDAELLIPGRGNIIRDASLVLDGPKISYAGPRAQAPATPGNMLQVPVVMPGMWDCHVHFIGLRGRVSTEELLINHMAVAVARSVKDAERTLLAGVTSVRDLGGYGVYLAEAVREGSIIGPSIYGAGQVISQTGGHADAHRLPHSWVLDRCRDSGTLMLADGVDECLRAVRLQLRAGAKVIKVCVSGGVVSELDDPFHQQFNDTELRTIVDEAHRAERVVAAHCHGKAGVIAALRAGCRTIEHGSELDDQTIDMMLETGAILVPTRSVFEGLRANAHLLPTTWQEQFTAFNAMHEKSVRLAHERGVTIAAGTDLGLSVPGSPLSFGAHGAELGFMTDLGLTPEEAITAATANAPLTLGPQAPVSGVLAKGYDGDVLALVEDPLRDITVLADPAKVSHVWKLGELVKSPTPESEP